MQVGAQDGRADADLGGFPAMVAHCEEMLHERDKDFSREQVSEAAN